MKVTILGCGPSWGVPKVGDDWGDCDPTNPRNRRRRAGIVVQENDTTILVDTPPDLREALLSCNINKIDTLVFTHAHADHIHGLDDMRVPCVILGRPVPAFGDSHTIEELRHRFAYAFTGSYHPAKGGYQFRPIIEPHEIEIGRVFEAAGVAVTPIHQTHGRSSSLGLRFGRFAYSTDVVAMDDAAFASLAGVEVWVVDCLRREPHPTHSHLAQSLAWIERVGPKRAILTHMDESLDYATLRRELPPHVEPAYDGMAIEV